MVVVASVIFMSLSSFPVWLLPLAQTINTKKFEAVKKNKSDEISICLKLSFGDRLFKATWSHDILNHLLLCSVFLGGNGAVHSIMSW